MKTTIDPARRLELYIRKARNGSKTFVFTNSSGADYDISSFDFELFIKKNPGARKDVISLLTSYAGFGLTISGNELTATFTDVITEIDSGEYYWELLRLDTNKTWLCGPCYVHEGEFDGVGTDTSTISIADTTTVTVTITESGGSSSWGSITGTLSNQSDLNTALSGKQATLVSGTNIKTINGSSVLGSGDLTVGGVSGLTAGRVPYAASATSLTDSVSLSWDNANLKLTVGTHFVQSHATGVYIGKNLGTVGMNTGVYNVVIGEDLGLAFTTATRNVLIGHDAGRAITSAQYNIAIGEAALRLSTTAGENVAIGYRALYQAIGEDNIGIGFGAAQNMVGGRNNILLGYYAGAAGAAGVVGRTDYTGGDDSIFIGSYLTTDNATEDAQINIGNVIFSRFNSGSNPIPYPQVGCVGIYITTPTARLHVPASTTTYASLRLPHGTAPTSPNDGDMWTTTAGLFVRINGVTVGPLS